MTGKNIFNPTLISIFLKIALSGLKWLFPLTFQMDKLSFSENKNNKKKKTIVFFRFLGIASPLTLDA